MKSMPSTLSRLLAPHRFKLRPTSLTTTILCFAFQGLWPTGVQALPLETNVRPVNIDLMSPVVTNQMLPDWTPVGQPKRQGNAASRNVPDFGDTGQPDSHSGGASRDIQSCPMTEVPLTVIAPADANYGGHTTQANPTLWVYVPFALNASNPIVFALLDENRNSLHESFQTVDRGPGVLKLTLPDDVVLEPEQVYHWFFMVHCDDPQGIHNALMVEGWIKRVADPLPDTDPLPNGEIPLSPEQRIEQSRQYADNLVWYDALTLLGDGLLENENDLTLAQAWTELLGYPSVQLESLSLAPLGDCCVLQDD